MSRPFTVIDAPQRSPEWFAARLGRVTGSKAACVMMGATTAGRADYLMQLAVERLTGQCGEQGFVSAEMQRGIDKEPMARMRAEMKGAFIRETGFLRHDARMIGASLDGDEHDFAIIREFKCPKTTTHVKYLQSDGALLVQDYKWQLSHNCLVADATGAVIGSFDDRLPPELDYIEVAVRASDLPVFEYERALTKFLREVDDLTAQLAELRARRA